MSSSSSAAAICRPARSCRRSCSSIRRRSRNSTATSFTRDRTSSRRSRITRIARSSASSAASRTSSRSTGEHSISRRRLRRRPARCSPATSATPTSTTPPIAASHKAVRAMFEEQVGWAVDAGVDFVIGETFSYAQEALIALDVVKQAKQVAVITLAMHKADVTREDWSVADACKRLADAGADVVGLNCIRGPATMMPLLREIRAKVKTHLAALPVPFRTSEDQPSFQSLRDTHWHFDEGAAHSPSRSIRSRATGSRSPSSDGKRPNSTSGISACAAARARITSARLPKRSASGRRRASIRPTCRSTRSSARTSGSGRCRRTTPTSSNAGAKRRAGRSPARPVTRQGSGTLHASTSTRRENWASDCVTLIRIALVL